MHIDLVQLVQRAGYIGIFLCIFLESFPMTFFLPGDSLLFATGFLASQGILNLWILIAIYFISGTLGYIFSYFLGQKIIRKFFSNPDSKIFNPKYITYTQQFFAKYGSKTIIIGRFVPIVRSFAPALAGMAGFTFGKFVRYTFLGVALWSVCMTMLGFFLGKIIPKAGDYITPIVVVIVVISVLPAVYEYVKKRRARSGQKLSS